MRRVICSVCVCVTLGLIASYDAKAQSKKKGKEPELAISKRGNLIFEDDFSGKEMLWTPTMGDWTIVRGTLVTKTTKQAKAARSFTPVDGFIAEATMHIPSKATVYLCFQGMQRLQTFGHIDTHRGIVALRQWGQEENIDVEVRPFSHASGKPCTVLFEVTGSASALTVNGIMVKHDSGIAASKYSSIALEVRQPDSSVFVIDDVKVYEALPKDEEPEKDEKKK